jgi:hypothetical protein
MCTWGINDQLVERLQREFWGKQQLLMRRFETMTDSFVRHACDRLKPVLGMIR